MALQGLEKKKAALFSFLNSHVNSRFFLSGTLVREERYVDYEWIIQEVIKHCDKAAVCPKLEYKRGKNYIIFNPNKFIQVD